MNLLISRTLRFLLVLLIGAFQFSFAGQPQTYQAVCYHDFFQQISPTTESDSVDTAYLINQFSWLKENGFTVISIQDVIDSNNGKKVLPEKSVLLTFDDGYESFYRFVFPLLKAYNYHATLAIVGSWIEVKPGGRVDYGGTLVPRDNFLTAGQIKEMSDSGLVEIASHSYASHLGVIATASGSEMPAITTHIYNQKTKAYETDQEYRKRLKADLQRNSDFIQSITGKKPRVMVWPYGDYTGVSQEVAKEVGMPISMSLDADDINVVENSSDMQVIRRIYINSNPKVNEFAKLLTDSPPLAQTRVMHVDLDYIYDKDPTQQEKNLDQLLERIQRMGVNTVFLQAFADDDASGVAKALYFPSRNMPMKADLFNRVSWAIYTRTTAKQVYAWLPLTAFVPKPDSNFKDLRVISSNGSLGVGYTDRLTPFSPLVRAFVSEIYEDLAKNAYFTGILIHDDAVLSDYEDANPVALQYYSRQWGLPPNIDAIRANPEMFLRWTRLKTRYLSQFANDLKMAAEKYRKPLKLARNYYAEPILNPSAEEWYGQALEDGLQNFDFVAVMAMPYFEKADNPNQWIEQLQAKVSKTPGALNKVIFELQAYDWNAKKEISSPQLSEWMDLLRKNGALNYGYYPDDPIKDLPRVEILRKNMSTQTLIN